MKITVNSGKIILIAVIIFIFSFSYFAKNIYMNKVLLDTDEMYWISTAKIVPLLVKHDYTDPYWNEYYGFVNFNVAKLAYGIGLPILGHTDFSQAGIPPDTYYKWESFGGKPFPATHQFNSTLRDARLISALFVSLGIILMFFCTLSITSSLLISTLSGILLTLHPIIQKVATHALADSMFLFFEIAAIFVLIKIISAIRQKNSHLPVYYCGAGICTAMAAGAKINGLMLLPFILFSILYIMYKLYINKNTDYTKKFRMKALAAAVILILSFSVTFLILHPNFFFYPQVSPIQMMESRMLITQQHIAYYSEHEPSHVLLSLPSKLLSSVIYLFPIRFGLVAIAGAIIKIIFRKKIINGDKYKTETVIICGLIYTWMCVLLYVVFDEPRYYLPILPFLILVLADAYNSTSTHKSAD